MATTSKQLKRLHWLLGRVSVTNHPSMLKPLPIKIARRAIDAFGRVTDPFGVVSGRRRVDYNGQVCLEIGQQPPEKGINLYFHGGAYIFGSPEIATGLCMYLNSSTDRMSLAVRYRLAPEYPLPAAVEDAVKVYEKVLEKTEPRLVSFSGDSAGGGLTLLTLQALRDAGKPLPGCACCISPYTDLKVRGKSHKTNFEKDIMLRGLEPKVFADIADMIVGNRDIRGQPTGAKNDPEDPRFSPLSSSFKGLPPIYFTVDEFEMLHDDVIAAHDKAKGEGVTTELDVVSGRFHSYPLLTMLIPEAQEAVQRMGNFILKHNVPLSP